MRLLAVLLRSTLLPVARRNRLLGGAIFATAFMLVLGTSLIEGVAHKVAATTGTLGGGQVHVMGYFKPRRDTAGLRLRNFEKVRDRIKPQVPELAYVTDRVRIIGDLVSETATVKCVFNYGVDLAEEQELRRALELAPQSEYVDGGPNTIVGSVDDLAKPDTMLLFAEQAKKMRVNVGDVITLAVTNVLGQSEAKDVRVAGVLRDIPDVSNVACYTNKQTLKQLAGIPKDDTTLLHLALRDPKDADAVAARLTDFVSREGFETIPSRATLVSLKIYDAQEESWTGPRLEIGPWQNELWWMGWRIDSARGLAILLQSTLLVALVLGVLNVTLVSVRERTGEIGTLRAMGMSKLRVGGWLVLEHALLAFAASGLGALGAIGVAVLVNQAGLQIDQPWLRYLLFGNQLHLAVELRYVAVVLPTVTVTVGLASMWAALKAAAIDPVVAMSSGTRN